MSLSLQSLAEDSLVNSRLTVAALALQSYDILLTFNDEVKYIWRGKWTLIKSIYLVCRYVSFINLWVFAFGAASSNPNSTLQRVEMDHYCMDVFDHRYIREYHPRTAVAQSLRERRDRYVVWFRNI
ncbi:hypothetical protein M422DRAFT_50674 [Sphaerobolus stellatus SS14]|uniref:DUF6533 domain-containing protein n=1 Tax=Sphaerobolus stellatus (strain SS14) TaxID=990650 RepID=A0A0C9VID5_SPHS4|nr:hypothetical protein M422DRAFT_50674 [Sphaerobolus stellatus SS14]